MKGVLSPRDLRNHSTRLVRLNQRQSHRDLGRYLYGNRMAGNSKGLLSTFAVSFAVDGFEKRPPNLSVTPGSSFRGSGGLGTSQDKRTVYSPFGAPSLSL